MCLNLNFEFRRDVPAPGEPPGTAWSAVGCSFRSRRPSIFEQDRPETDPAGRRREDFPRGAYTCIYMYICIRGNGDSIPEL